MTEPYVVRELRGTSSTRRVHSRSDKFIWVASIDRRNLESTEWEVVGGLPPFFRCKPSPDGSLYVVLTRVEGSDPLPASVHKGNVQDGWRVRFWITLDYFLPIVGDPNTLIQLMSNGELRIYYPPALKTGKSLVDDIMHGRRKAKGGWVVG